MPNNKKGATSFLNLIEEMNVTIDNIKRNIPKKRNFPILDSFCTPYSFGLCDPLARENHKEPSDGNCGIKAKRG